MAPVPTPPGVLHPVNVRGIERRPLLRDNWDPGDFVERPAALALAPELQEFVKKELAPYKYPRQVEFVEKLPRTETGKIRRVELRQRELDRGSSKP